MLAISLIFVGITLILNGLMSIKKADSKTLIMLNFFTAFIVISFNIYQIFLGDNTLLVGSMGGLLFGLTNLLFAFDLTYKEKLDATGWYSLFATICALSISAYYFTQLTILKAVLWLMWSMIWLFTFIGFSLNKKFKIPVYIMFIVQGAVTTGAFGLLMLFDIIKF